MFANAGLCLPKIWGIVGPMDLERFSRIVRERRIDLGLTQEEVAESGGPTDTTMGKIENAEWNPGSRLATLRKLDVGLRWEPGSAKRALNGGDPTPLREAPRGAPMEPQPLPQGDIPAGAVRHGTLLWNAVVEVADAASGTALEARAERAVIIAADVIPELVLSLNPGPAARPLIEQTVRRGIVAVHRFNARNQPQGERHDLEAAPQSDASPEAREGQEAGSLDDSQHPDSVVTAAIEAGLGESVSLEESNDRHQKRG